MARERSGGPRAAGPTTRGSGSGSAPDSPGTGHRDSQRDDKSGFTVAEVSNSNDGNDAGSAADMTMPRGEPFEDLERGAVGELFEAAPLGFDGGKAVVDFEFDLAGQTPRALRRNVRALKPKIAVAWHSPGG